MVHFTFCLFSDAKSTHQVSWDEVSFYTVYFSERPRLAEGKPSIALMGEHTSLYYLSDKKWQECVWVHFSNCIAI